MPKSPKVPAKQNGSKRTGQFGRTWWYQRRRLIAMIGLFGILAVFRGYWWPNCFQALARSALQRHDNELALKWLDWTTLIAAETGETAFLRGRAYRHMGQLDQSALALKRAQQLHVSLTRLQREQWLGQAQSGQLREAEPHLSTLLMDPQEDTEEICDAYVLGYIRTQRQNQALQILKSWIGDSPKSPRPYILRARILELTANYKAAADDLGRAVALDPSNAEASFELASVLQQGSDCVRAMPYFERNLNHPKFASRAHLGLARCLKTSGSNDRVRSLLEKAIALQPKNTAAMSELGRLDLESEKYASAIGILQRAVALAPRDEEIHFLLAQCLKADGKAEEAQPHFDFVQKFREAFQELSRLEDRLSKNPMDVAALVRAGEILMDVSDPEEGVVRLLSALQIDPKNADARKLLAEHYDRRAATNPEFRRLADEFRNEPR